MNISVDHLSDPSFVVGCMEESNLAASHKLEVIMY